jgi:hypothetical protein
VAFCDEVLCGIEKLEMWLKTACWFGCMAPVCNKFVIHSKAIVCQDVKLKGDITIGLSKFLICPVVTFFERA